MTHNPYMLSLLHITWLRERVVVGLRNKAAAALLSTEKMLVRLRWLSSPEFKFTDPVMC